MSNTDRDIRMKVAALARELYDGKIAYNEFIKQASETEDEDIEELLDLIEHEPKKGSLFGVDAKTHANYIATVFALINKLEQE